MTSSHPHAAVHRILLTNFRNHASLTVEPEGRSVALIGPNGAGKTNILEAISLLTPGRGLRRAAQSEFAHLPGNGAWAVAADVEGAAGMVRLGTGLEAAGGEPAPRKCRIDAVPVSGPGAFAEHLRIVWLTPAMDGLFMGSGGDRRRFLDRLVLAVDPEHGARVSSFERALRSRNRLLEEPSTDSRWLDAVEHEAAELAVALSIARTETVSRLFALIQETQDPQSLFPWAQIALEPWLDSELSDAPAAAQEDLYRQSLRELRPRDRAAGRTTLGPHTADLVVAHGPKSMPAEKCSTGEQKMLLLGLVLAHARLVARLEGLAPVLLLDEVAAHLDPNRRIALYETIENLGAQAWLTGADPAAFEALENRAAMFEIAPGRAKCAK